MIKIIRNSIVALALTVSAVSCNDDFLTQDVKGTQTLDNYFNNTKECEAQVFGCYQGLAFDDWWQVYNAYVTADVCTDDEWMGNTTQGQDGYADLALYQGKTTSGTLSNFWQYRYKAIHRCNVVLTYMPNVKSIPEDKQKRFSAEAKFLRAYFYFELVNFFGGVPLIVDMATASVPKSTAAEVYARIEKDLLEAIPDLPTRSATVTDATLGRATSGAALSLLAKAYLFQEKYADAQKCLDQVIQSGEYELLPEFKDVWTIATNNSKEGVFEIQTDGNESYSVGERISVVTGSRDDSGWSWGGPTSDLENAYLNAGDNIRLASTIIKDGATEIPNETAKTFASNSDKALFPYPVSGSKHKSGRANAKLYIPQALRSSSAYDAPHIPLNYRLIRYADVLLMAAEVYNAVGNDAKAKEYLNMVRSRVSLPAVASTGKDLRDAIRLERRLELALEGKRLFDLRRWTDDNGKKAICNIMGPNGTWVIYNTKHSTDPYETTNDREPQNEGQDFVEGRDILFPIPNTEIVQSNGVLVQNPGY